MASKKSVKKLKKKTKKSQKKSQKKHKKTLLEKIDAIRARVPYIEPTGEYKDPHTRELLFKFTEAQKVFEIYRNECNAEELIYRPYYGPLAPVTAVAGRSIFVALPFCIQDIKTGDLLAGWGFGGGMNGDWSANTAHTRALKQFLLTVFQTTWRDPEISRREQITSDAILQAQQAMNELGEYFDSSLGVIKNERDRSKNTKTTT